MYTHRPLRVLLPLRLKPFTPIMPRPYSPKLVVGMDNHFSIRGFRAQNYQFELFELVLSSKLDKRFPVEQFEATVSHSAVPSPLLICRSSRSTWTTTAATTNKQTIKHINRQH